MKNAGFARRFFCDASAPDQGDRGRAVELSAHRAGVIAEAEQAARRVAKQPAALGRIGEQHLRQFEQRAVILPLRRAQVRPIGRPQAAVKRESVDDGAHKRPSVVERVGDLRKFRIAGQLDADPLGNAAPTNLMARGTNGAATIIGSSRQNLGNLECWGWWCGVVEVGEGGDWRAKFTQR
jgi:hypothetical protein